MNKSKKIEKVYMKGGINVDSATKMELSDVTLVCIDDVDPFTAYHIMYSLNERIKFADMKLFSSKEEDYVTHKIDPINSLKDYSMFAIKGMHHYIDSKFVMFVQRDGYPVNLKGWLPEFLEYDYIGAPWTWIPIESRWDQCPVGKCVGNGGFSIRSLDLMKTASKYDYDGSEGDEDIFLCRVKGDELKSEGHTFAPAELACYFSVENWLYNGQFGFHGPRTIAMNKKFKIFNFESHAYEKDYMD